jgi:uncharacterized protein (DUF1330 family)
VNSDRNLLEYRSRVLATVERYEGRYLLVGGKCEIVEGDWQPVFPVLIRFPTLEHAHCWYNSVEYRDLKAMRLAATKGCAVFMDSEVNEFVHDA